MSSRDSLARALIDWKDAGGSVCDVVNALDIYLAASRPARDEGGGAYVPKVGDVVRCASYHDEGIVWVVTRLGSASYGALLEAVALTGRTGTTRNIGVGLLKYVRPATPSERAAAGLPADAPPAVTLDPETVGLLADLRALINSDSYFPRTSAMTDTRTEHIRRIDALLSRAGASS